MSAASFPSTVLLPFVAAGGFALLRGWGATRMLHKLEPARVYVLWVGSTGLVLALVAVTFVVLVDQAWIITAHLVETVRSETYENQLVSSARALVPSVFQWNLAMILAFIIGLAMPAGLNRWQLSEVLSRRFIEADLASSAFGRLAIRSLETDLPLALTLDTGHVIIGHPVSLESFSAISNDVAILPFASGYRDETDHRLVPRVSYGWIYELDPEEQQSFVKAVSRERIVSANLFDEEKFLNFNTLDDPVDLGASDEAVASRSWRGDDSS